MKLEHGYNDIALYDTPFYTVKTFCGTIQLHNVNHKITLLIFNNISL